MTKKAICACGHTYIWHPQVTPGWSCPDCGTVIEYGS